MNTSREYHRPGKENLKANTLLAPSKPTSVSNPKSITGSLENTLFPLHQRKKASTPSAQMTSSQGQKPFKPNNKHQNSDSKSAASSKVNSSIDHGRKGARNLNSTINRVKSSHSNEQSVKENNKNKWRNPGKENITNTSKLMSGTETSSASKKKPTSANGHNNFTGQVLGSNLNKQQQQKRSSNEIVTSQGRNAQGATTGRGFKNIKNKVIGNQAIPNEHKVINDNGQKNNNLNQQRQALKELCQLSNSNKNTTVSSKRPHDTSSSNPKNNIPIITVITPRHETVTHQYEQSHAKTKPQTQYSLVIPVQGHTAKIIKKPEYIKLHQQSRQHQTVDIPAPKPKKNWSIDDFAIGKKLGKGRFGDVFMAQQRASGFLLAIKVIDKKQLVESEMINQLVFQIKIQSYLSHPNALKLYGWFNDHKNVYLLLELATAGCLFRELKTKGSFKEDQAAYYLRQVVAALKTMHSQWVMHRDIKPQNILNSFGVLKLCDFGWAVYSPLYQRQTFCGTLDYVPPQIVVGEFYDQKVDIWCLGILCYELCTGRAPFEARNNEMETYDKILALDLQFPVQLTSDVVDFVGRLLVKDPSRRMSFQQIQNHPWMKKHQNEAGRMISKEIWDAWLSLKG